MRLGKRVVILPAILAIVLAVGGCCKKQEEQIAFLSNEKANLQTQNTELQGLLKDGDAREAELRQKLDDRDLALDQKKAEVANLEKRLAAAAVASPPPAKSGWTSTPLGDMVTLGSDILFPSGRDTLTRAGMARLDRIAADLGAGYAGLRVRVYGHTDSDPIRKTRRLWKDNLDLSANRAMAVTRYLVTKGIRAKRVESVAMGEHHPIAPNQGNGKAKNRRVEIVVIKK